MDAALPFYSSTLFLEKSKQTARRTLFQHPTYFRDTPTSYTPSLVQQVWWCRIQAWVALHHGVLFSNQEQDFILLFVMHEYQHACFQ